MANKANTPSNGSTESPQGNNGNGYPKPRPNRRRNQWTQLVGADTPISVIKLVLLATAVTILTRYVFSALEQYPFHVHWALVALMIYVVDSVLRAWGRTGEWMKNNPYSDWTYKPQTISDFALVVLIVVLLGVVLYFTAPSASDAWKWVNTQVSRGLTALGLKEGENPTASDPFLSLSNSKKLEELMASSKGEDLIEVIYTLKDAVENNHTLDKARYERILGLLRDNTSIPKDQLNPNALLSGTKHLPFVDQVNDKPKSAEPPADMQRKTFDAPEIFKLGKISIKIDPKYQRGDVNPLACVSLARAREVLPELCWQECVTYPKGDSQTPSWCLDPFYQ